MIKFILLGYKLEPLKPKDVIDINSLMTFTFNRSMAMEILRVRLSGIISDEKLDEILGFYPAESGTIYPDFEAKSDLFENIFFYMRSDLEILLPTYHLFASNA